MAYSTQRAVSDGSLVTLPLSIDYFDRTEITVFFDSLPATTGWAWVGTTDKTISFSPAVPAGVEVLVRRATLLDKARNVFSLGAQFLARTLDENTTQVLRVAQEVREGAGVAEVYNDLNMHGYRLRNVADAVDLGDAITLRQYLKDLGGAAAAGASAAAAAAAVVAANAAAATANAAAALAAGAVNTFKAALASPTGVALVGGAVSLVQMASDSGSSLIGFLAAGVGAVRRTLQSKLRESASITDFGADPSLDDNRAAIQRAIDSGIGRLHFPVGVFKVKPDPNAAGLAGVFGLASVCLKPRSNLKMYGPGTLQLATGAGGTSGAVIGNWDGAAINNFVAEDIYIDGNRANTTGTMSGIVLVDATECGYQSVKAKHLTYCGLQMRRSSGVGGTGLSNMGVKDCWIKDCRVDDIAYIGIQANRVDGIRIKDNDVSNTGDNAIDVEGDDTTGGQANGGFGRAVIVAGNSINNCAGAGIFIESCGDVMVAYNRIRDAAFSMYFNRISSGSLDNQVVNNKMSRKTTPGGYGIVVSNNSGDIRIAENVFDSFASSIRLVNTGVDVSIGVNTHKNITDYCLSFPTTTNSVVRGYMEKQIIKGADGGVATALPSIHPPIGCPSNFPNRTFHFASEPCWSLALGAVVLPGYKLGDFVLTYSSGWAAYSLYNFGSDGKTRVYPSSKPTGSLYFKMSNGYAYRTTGNNTDGSTILQQWNSGTSTWIDGNFTTVLNSALAGETYSSFWGTQ